METLDYIVGGGVLFMTIIAFIDSYISEVFESAGIPAAISACFLFISAGYFFSGSSPWIAGACIFVSALYAITAGALKGSR